MDSEAIDWEQDLPLDADEAYRSLVRSLRRTDGFALLFVRCSPVQGDRIINDVRADLPSKTIEVLELKESIDNLYDHVAALPNHDQVNVLFIKGIEYSIFAYEDREMNDINLRSQSSVYGGTWQGVPRVLSNLNLSRERFRDNFKICFVFLLREFALQYFIRRAPDFFDWRSGVFDLLLNQRDFPNRIQPIIDKDTKIVEQSLFSGSEHLVSVSVVDIYTGIGYSSSNYDTAENRDSAWDKVSRNVYRDNNDKKKGKDFDKDRKEKKSWDNTLETYYEDATKNFTNKAKIMLDAGRYEEAIRIYDKSLELNDNSYEVWNMRGKALHNLGRYEEAIASFKKALIFNPNYQEAKDNKFLSSRDLGEVEKLVNNSLQNFSEQIEPEIIDQKNKRMKEILDLFRNS
jgi:tetratricopeptide (TPR) repeat protein